MSTGTWHVPLLLLRTGCSIIIIIIIIIIISSSSSSSSSSGGGGGSNNSSCSSSSCYCELSSYPTLAKFSLSFASVWGMMLFSCTKSAKSLD
jgi:hypothetical protein